MWFSSKEIKQPKGKDGWKIIKELLTRLWNKYPIMFQSRDVKYDNLELQTDEFFDQQNRPASVSIRKRLNDIGEIETILCLYIIFPYTFDLSYDEQDKIKENIRDLLPDNVKDQNIEHCDIYNREIMIWMKNYRITLSCDEYREKLFF